jgi:hypothetical protein
LFSRVLEERVSAGVRSGLIATAATSGVLVAYGIRSGSISASFLFLGRYLGGFQDALYPQGTIVLAGFLLHAAWIVAWCVAYAFVASALRPSLRLPAACVISALAFWFSTGLIGSALEFSGIGAARWVFLHIVLAIAMLVGTRFALPDR